MLLVDKIIEIGPKHIIGLKNVSGNEPFFAGHFPKEPIMPGVLLVRGYGSTGGLLVLNSVEETGKILNILYENRQREIPPESGSRRYFIIPFELLAPIRRGISTMKGYVFVGERIVCEAEFMAQITKKQIKQINDKSFSIY